MEEKEETLRQKLRYDMRLRVSRTDHAFGPGVAELMEHVEATGSLSKGCKCMQMAYSKGWKILKRAEEDLGIPLVQGNRGGSNGGQTVLTPEGKGFLKRYRKFCKKSISATFPRSPSGARNTPPRWTKTARSSTT